MINSLIDNSIVLLVVFQFFFVSQWIYLGDQGGFWNSLFKSGGHFVKTTIPAIEFSAKEHTVGVTFEELLHQVFDC
jgi:hypothetical protein